MNLAIAGVDLFRGAKQEDEDEYQNAQSYQEGVFSPEGLGLIAPL